MGRDTDDVQVPVILLGLESRVVLGEELGAEGIGDALEGERGEAGEEGDMSDLGELGQAYRRSGTGEGVREPQGRGKHV